MLAEVFADKPQGLPLVSDLKNPVARISCRDVLVVVDVQNDFVTGALALPDANTVIDPINTAATIFTNVVITKDWHPRGHVSFASTHPGTRHGDTMQVSYGSQMVFHDHCVQDSWGAELHPELRLGKAQLILHKGYRREVDSFGCFYENDQVTKTGLAEYLRARSIERTFFAGLARFGCVLESALGAARDGFAAFMIDDASAGGAMPDEALALRRMSDAGVCWVHSRDLLVER